MQFSRLKELVKRLGGVLVLDGDEPEFVILSYGEYEKIETNKEAPFSIKHNRLSQSNNMITKGISNEEDQETFEKLNQEILALKEDIRQKEEAELVADEQSTEPVAETIDFE